MAQLAIKGHATRGEEVIEILEMFGGRNDINYVGELPNYAYAIDKRGIIDWHIRHEHDFFNMTHLHLKSSSKNFPIRLGIKCNIKEQHLMVLFLK